MRVSPFLPGSFDELPDFRFAIVAGRQQQTGRMRTPCNRIDILRVRSMLGQDQLKCGLIRFGLVGLSENPDHVITAGRREQTYTVTQIVRKKYIIKQWIENHENTFFSILTLLMR